MKEFLKTILLILTILLIINIALDCVFSSLFRHSQSEPYKEWNCIINDSIDADLLVMGNSRAWAQYDPHILDSILCVNSYNIALNGNDVRRQIVKYKVYRHYQRKKPTFLIFNIDYWGNFTEASYQFKQFFPYITNSYMRRFMLQDHLVYKLFLYIPMARYYYHGLYSMLDELKNKDDTYKGYKAHALKWDGTEFAKLDGLEFSPNQDLVDVFDNFMKELKEEDIKVILVSSPIYKGVTEITVNLSEFYDFRQQFSEKYNVPILDYINDSICNDTAYFYNATHLNKTGAELFTTKLCHDLDSLGLLK
jgi:hypothetical protein